MDKQKVAEVQAASEFINVKAAAVALEITPKYLRKLIRAKHIRAYRPEEGQTQWQLKLTEATEDLKKYQAEKAAAAAVKAEAKAAAELESEAAAAAAVELALEEDEDEDEAESK